MRQIKLIVAAVFLMSPMAANARLITFDFENISDPVGENGALVSNGFVFDPGDVDWFPEWSSEQEDGWIGHYHIADPTDPRYDAYNAYNGSKYLIVDYFLDASILNIYGASGQVFGVRQFDLAEAGGPGPDWPCQQPPFEFQQCDVTYIGVLAGGGIISQTVTLDGISDGIGPLDDFETFTFDGRWNRLTMFSIVPKASYLGPGLDNLVIRTVPEPSTLALLGIGLFGMGLARRNKKA